MTLCLLFYSSFSVLWPDRTERENMERWRQRRLQAVCEIFLWVVKVNWNCLWECGTTPGWAALPGRPALSWHASLWWWLWLDYLTNWGWDHTHWYSFRLQIKLRLKLNMSLTMSVSEREREREPCRIIKENPNIFLMVILVIHFFFVITLNYQHLHRVQFVYVCVYLCARLLSETPQV